MKKIFFLLYILLLCFLLWILYSFQESLELLPLEPSDTTSNIIDIKLSSNVDRVECKDSYKYCYNGELFKSDIFGISAELEDGESYTYGKTYSDICYQKVYLDDFTQNETLKGSSKTRDVYYEPYEVCNLNEPWYLKLPIETINVPVCTSTKDIENYNTCVETETPCKPKDIYSKIIVETEPYNCSENETVQDSMKDTQTSFSREIKEIGTYKDTRNRALNVYKARKNLNGQLYTKELCSLECKNYDYFGLQNGERGNPECWCGNSLEDSTQYGTKLCSSAVGGAWCNSVYKNICSFETINTEEVSDVCTISNERLIYNDAESKCKSKCNTRTYPDLSHCYTSESEASYQYDNYYYDLNDSIKYPFDVKPLNPNDYTPIKESEFNTDDKVRLKSDVKQITYSVPLCTKDKPLYANDECHPIESKNNIIDDNCNIDAPYVLNGLCVNYETAINDISTNCTKEKPYKYNNTCYASIDTVYKENSEYIFNYKQNDLCYLKDRTLGVSCEDLYSIDERDKSMLYNPVTNNYVGQLKEGDYSTLGCSGNLTQCIEEFPYEKNSDGNLVPIFDVNTTRVDKIPEYPEPPPYKEPSISKYISPYNSNIQNSLFIQCKRNYNEIPELNMCPKDIPICQGYVEGTQLGMCTESKKTIQSIEPYNINSLYCKDNYNSIIPKEDMCPYNLPYCEENRCKENSLFHSST